MVAVYALAVAGSWLAAGLGIHQQRVERVDLSPAAQSGVGTTVPAVGVIVLEGDQVRGIGVAGVTALGRDERVMQDDLWHLGSCGKAMTATVVGMMIEDGTLKRGSTLEELLPDWQSVLAQPLRTRTISELLTHRSGLAANASGMMWIEMFSTELAPRAARETLLRSQVKRARRGSNFEYSNLGYALAGHVAERAESAKRGAETSYEQVMQDRLFGPLGMTVVFGAPRKVWGHRKLPTGGEGGSGEVKIRSIKPGPDADNPPVVAPAGTMAMSLESWGKFAALHLLGDVNNPERRVQLLSTEMFDTLHTPVGSEQYACGWIVSQGGKGSGSGIRVLSHAGSNTMWFAEAWLAPAMNRGVLVVTNSGEGRRVTRSVRQEAWKLTFGETIEQSMQKKHEAGREVPKGGGE